MNVTISSEKSCFTVSITQENLAKLIAFAMEIAENEKNLGASTETGLNKEAQGLSESSFNSQSIMDTPFLPEESAGTGEQGEIIKPAGTYKGFMRLRCQKCGAVHSFCAKTPISEYRCYKCGGKTELENMHRMFVECKCGSKYSYYTNEMEEMITHDCLNCGAPVDLKFNSRRTAYVTILDCGGIKQNPYRILTRKGY